MPYPAETVEGEIVQIVEKGTLGETEILRATDGSIYKRSATEELKIELIQLGEAVENSADAVRAEVEESVTEIVAEAREQLEEVKNASVLDAPAEAVEALDAVVQEVKEGIEEVGEAVKAGVDSVLEEAGDVVDAAAGALKDPLDLLNREDDVVLTDQPAPSSEPEPIEPIRDADLSNAEEAELADLEGASPSNEELEAEREARREAEAEA